MATPRRTQTSAPKLTLIKTPKNVVPSAPVQMEHVFSNLARWDDELWDVCEHYENTFGYEPNCMLVEPGYLKLLNVALNNRTDIWPDLNHWVEFDKLSGLYDIDFIPYDGLPPGLVLIGWTEPEPKWGDDS